MVNFLSKIKEIHRYMDLYLNFLIYLLLQVLRTYMNMYFFLMKMHALYLHQLDHIHYHQIKLI